MNSSTVFGLYLHLPFCASKCTYCDFNSIVAPAHQRKAYLQALVKEMRYYAASSYVKGSAISSVFWGGGTPTYYDVDSLAFLLEELRRYFVIPEDVEWSVEANPGTLSREKLLLLRRAGVNRISLGVQSFDDHLLQRIGRSHTVAEAVAAVSLIKECGFSNISLDLIYGLPGQTLPQYRQTLEQALQLKPQHLSLYGLQLEEGTELERLVRLGRLSLPGEDDELAMFHLGGEMLQEAGFQHYEVSNYALPGRRCQHNLVYWHNREYLGLGAGAYSYLERKRFGHIASPVDYVAAWQSQDIPAVAECESISAEMEQAETLMLGFRIVEGINIADFNARFSVDFMQKYGSIADELIKRGLLVQDGLWLRLTRQGVVLNNQVCGAFLPN